LSSCTVGGFSRRVQPHEWVDITQKGVVVGSLWYCLGSCLGGLRNPTRMSVRVESLQTIIWEDTSRIRKGRLLWSRSYILLELHGSEFANTWVKSASTIFLGYSFSKFGEGAKGRAGRYDLHQSFQSPHAIYAKLNFILESKQPLCWRAWVPPIRKIRKSKCPTADSKKDWNEEDYRRGYNVVVEIWLSTGLQRYIAEDSTIHNHLCENLKSCKNWNVYDFIIASHSNTASPFRITQEVVLTEVLWIIQVYWKPPIIEHRNTQVYTSSLWSRFTYNFTPRPIRTMFAQEAHTVQDKEGTAILWLRINTMID
jgi:hypothetical protein